MQWIAVRVPAPDRGRNVDTSRPSNPRLQRTAAEPPRRQAARSRMRSLLALWAALAIGWSSARSAIARDAPALLCRDIHSIAPRDLLLFGVLRGTDDVVLDGERICSSDGYEPGTINCGYEYEIKDLAALRPTTDTDVRMVSIVKNHLTGSGAVETVRGFQCKDAHLAAVFSKEFLYGASFELISATQFALTGGYWSGRDSTCCPAYKKRVVYSWDSRRGQYRAGGETFLKRNPTTNADEPVAKPGAAVPQNP